MTIVPETASADTVVLHVGGLHWATEKAVVEEALGRRPGVLAVEANPVAQTATVTYDPGATTVADLRRWVEECGFHCAGRSVPGHVCDPLAEPREAVHPDEAARHRADEAHGGGHGGHAGMSMAAMVRDMRNRFLVALLLSIPIVIWSPLGSDVLQVDAPGVPGISDDLFQFLLSLPVIFYSSWVFFSGAWRALRARTLDMMVLVAVAVGAGWVYSVAATFWIEGEVSTRRRRCWRPSCSSATGWRCGRAEAPTRRSARCSTWRRRWRWCCATESRWRCPPPISWSAICC